MPWQNRRRRSVIYSSKYPSIRASHPYLVALFGCRKGASGNFGNFGSETPARVFVGEGRCILLTNTPLTFQGKTEFIMLLILIVHVSDTGNRSDFYLSSTLVRVNTFREGRGGGGRQMPTGQDVVSRYSH
ncbi:uncharacterized protein BDW43DRAFT_278323 [Aspergillus alliaceus]|uniref:uncharacterized protein n=1 Tax=Petromyces alliaceus TaxID=209559 RepID=UPI0012A61F87|nr:uncharacterized protein BDW43DRAFT_278323 [Aspergillus alliaceus]KAB8232698.1 hypothetical protein BDW43DRAFT_278323 [Aspergillus alliaceus]